MDGADAGEAEVVGRVIGTQDATPLEFWVGIAPDRFLQLDDVVATTRSLPGRPDVTVYGIVTQVRARHEGARFDSDVFVFVQIVEVRAWETLGLVQNCPCRFADPDGCR